MSYCNVQDLRAEGFDEEKYSDEKLENLVKLSCDFIDKVTGQFFEPRELAVRLDGRGGRILALPYPLIDVEFIEIDSELISDFVIYNRLEDRPYPKIYRDRKWTKGKLNILVKGTWGYVEEDGSTPEDIKRISRKLAIYNFPDLSDAEAQEDKNLRGLLVSETTDGHSYKLSDDAVNNLYSSSITGDTEIDEVLRAYSRSKLRLGIA